MSGGYIQVIVTTNFDRLLEQALESVGITPTVIDSADTVRGAVPLQHLGCVIVKPHGDYLDTRIRNTPSELDDLGPKFDELLGRVFDEYGLIVCGWSGEWDGGLRRILERSRRRWFATYWTSRGEPKVSARDTIQRRGAQTISIESADCFFRTLTDQVRALADYRQPDTVSTAVAVARLKSYLPDEAARIRLNDLVSVEATRLSEAQQGQQFNVSTPYNDEEWHRRLERYGVISQTLVQMMVTGCYWGASTQAPVWSSCVERIGNFPEERSGYSAWLRLRWLPPVLVFYAGAIACLAASNFETFAALVKADINGTPAVRKLHPWMPANNEPAFAQNAVGPIGKFTGFSEYLFRSLRPSFGPITPIDRIYERYFNRCEYLLALVHADERAQHDANWSGWVPVGRFVYAGFGDNPERTIEAIDAEIDKLGIEWEPLRSGLFDGSIERLDRARSNVNQWIRSRVWAWG